jgi:hypothetical protein
MTATSYDLMQVGKSGKKLHALDPLDPDGRVYCETRTASRNKHLLQDGNGRYSDRTLWSPVFPTGKQGLPTCTDCLALLQR